MSVESESTPVEEKVDVAAEVETAFAQYQESLPESEARDAKPETEKEPDHEEENDGDAGEANPVDPVRDAPDETTRKSDGAGEGEGSAQEEEKQRLLSRAEKELGLSAEEAKAENPDTLARLFSLRDRQFAALGRQAQNPKTDDESKNSATTTQAAAGKTLTLDPEVYGEEVVAEIEGLKAQLEKATKLSQDLHMSNLMRQVDHAMDSLPEDLFGRGAVDDLPKAQQENRVKVWNAAKLLSAGMVAEGLQPPPLRDLVERAYGMEFYKHIEKTAATAKTQRLRSADKGRLRPSNMSGKKAASKHPAGSPEAILADPEVMEFVQAATERAGR